MKRLLIIVFLLCQIAVFGQGFYWTHSAAGFKPAVTTADASSILEVEALSGGNVISIGSAAVTERGVCYGTSANPTTAGDKISSGTGLGAFNAYLTSLSEGTLYHFRAYAINSYGTAYGEDKTFTTGTSVPGNGKLYNWYAAAGTGDTAICAAGWHLPSAIEMDTLMKRLDPAGTPTNNVAGKKMKETGTTHWLSQSSGTDNSSGFTAFGAGKRRYNDAIFEVIKQGTDMWASYFISGEAAFGSLTYNLGVFYSSGNRIDPRNGNSVRLIKDDSTDPGTYTGNDGQTYATVKIGNQVWLSENLKETKYRNGNDIPEYVGTSQWANAITGAFCWYNNNSNYE